MYKKIPQIVSEGIINPDCTLWRNLGRRLRQSKHPTPTPTFQKRKVEYLMYKKIPQIVSEGIINPDCTLWRKWDCGHFQMACCRDHLDVQCPICTN